MSATADFEIGASTLQITLTNTSASVGDIKQVLDGIAFTFVGGSDVKLTGVTATGFLDCTTGSCVSVGAFQQYPGNPQQSPFDVPSPYGWVFSGGLFAGGGSFKPAGIVNNTIDGSLDGLRNREHNDYLLGSVEFDFTFTAAPTDVSDVSFFWGTGGDSTPGNPTCTTACVLQQAPEPGSIALMGLALSGLAWARRRGKA